MRFLPQYIVSRISAKNKSNFHSIMKNLDWEQHPAVSSGLLTIDNDCFELHDNFFKIELKLLMLLYSSQSYMLNYAFE